MIECSVLNRLRGIGDVLRVGNFRVTGIMLYALYLMVVVTMISEWYYGLAFVVLFVAGESYAWGKWIGYLVDYEADICDFGQLCSKHWGTTRNGNSHKWGKCYLYN